MTNSIEPYPTDAAIKVQLRCYFNMGGSVGQAQPLIDDRKPRQPVGYAIGDANNAVAMIGAGRTAKLPVRFNFRVNDDKGQVRLVYMQISKNTFLELNPANAERPAGFTHYGLHVDSAADAVAMFKKRGVTVSDTNTSDTKAVLANITDPYMGRIELAELTPESMHFKAIQSWK